MARLSVRTVAGRRNARPHFAARSASDANCIIGRGDEQVREIEAGSTVRRLFAFGLVGRAGLGSVDHGLLLHHG